MRNMLLMLTLSAVFTGAASAGTYTLKSGTWSFYEGLQIDAAPQASARSSRSICVKPYETEADESWFLDLAKPRANCSATVLSETPTQISAKFVCPQGNITMNAPSTIRIYENKITIDSKLNYDLPVSPMSMTQQKTVVFSSSACSGQSN
jgi:Protein of unknown function (DUF3617).